MNDRSGMLPDKYLNCAQLILEFPQLSIMGVAGVNVLLELSLAMWRFTSFVVIKLKL